MYMAPGQIHQEVNLHTLLCLLPLPSCLLRITWAPLVAVVEPLWHFIRIGAVNCVFITVHNLSNKSDTSLCHMRHSMVIKLRMISCHLRSTRSIFETGGDQLQHLQYVGLRWFTTAIPRPEAVCGDPFFSPTAEHRHPDRGFTAQLTWHESF